MKFLIALPDHNYYLWQMIVQMNNLKKMGYDKDTIYVIGITNSTYSKNLKNILFNNNTRCKIHVYRDDRKNYKYNPAMTANVLYKLFRDNPEFKDEHFFYIDPDVIFTKKIRFNDLLKNNIWYLSNTKSYLDTKYIKSKSEELFYRMCRVVNIDPKIVEENDKHAGGAQVLMKNVTADFWKKVEKDSENLYDLMEKTKHIYSPNTPIQSWTAEMWALLWNAWLFKHETKIIKRFDFSWATDPISKWEKTNIFHNAGAVNDNDGLFCKTNYQKSPFNQRIGCNKKYCGANYVKEIKEAEKNFKNIIF